MHWFGRNNGQRENYYCHKSQYAQQKSGKTIHCKKSNGVIWDVTSLTLLRNMVWETTCHHVQRIYHPTTCSQWAIPTWICPSPLKTICHDIHTASLHLTQHGIPQLLMKNSYLPMKKILWLPIFMNNKILGLTHLATYSTNYYDMLSHGNTTELYHTILAHEIFVDTITLTPQDLKHHLPNLDLLHPNFG